MHPRFADAVSHWRSGRAQDAERTCSALLAIPQQQADARALLAEIYHAHGRLTDAIEQLRVVASLRPDDAAVWRRLGDAQFAVGAPEAAAVSFSAAIALQPRHPRAHNNLGRALARLGRKAEAIESFSAAIALEPGYAIAHNNLGIVLAESDQLDSALLSYARACELNPSFAEAYCNQGNVLLRLDRAEEALGKFESALRLGPPAPAALSNCGNALLNLGRAAEALAYFEEALRLQPDFVPALNNRGNALRGLRRFTEALGSYERALSLQSDYVEALSNRAGVLLDLERYDEAILCSDRLLQVRPDFPSALMYRAIALSFMPHPRHADAVRDLARLREVEPAQPYGLGSLLHSSAMICDWSHRGLVPEAVQAARDSKPLVSPLAFLALSDSAELQRRCASAYVKAARPPSAQPIWRGERWQNPKIRVAYLSGDLRNHALSFLMVGVFEKHNRERFDVYGVSFREPENNPFGARVLSALDFFWDVREQTDLQVAHILREMRVDIAVDLVGFTRGERMGIFAHRPVPVQVGYLGFPATSGAPYMDYILADDFVIPAASRELYSEKVVYLPDCFQANDDRRVISDRIPDRAGARLPKHALVFCCFNNAYKFSPELFAIWCRLLQTNQDSVLWLLAESDATRSNLLQEAARRGIAAQRLVFAERLPYDEHLARLGLADLFLDTFPFNAGTTASDALWAGLPVLTCSGEAFASRMAGSLLRTMGLPELIADDLDHYEQLALRLAASPAQLASLRLSLQSSRVTGPLFDTERFCRNLESAYTTMHERVQRGEHPANFSVPQRMLS